MSRSAYLQFFWLFSVVPRKLLLHFGKLEQSKKFKIPFEILIFNNISNVQGCPRVNGMKWKPFKIMKQIGDCDTSLQGSIIHAMVR